MLPDKSHYPGDDNSGLVQAPLQTYVLTAQYEYWKPFAIAAIIFMTVNSFVGWWYQRRIGKCLPSVSSTNAFYPLRAYGRLHLAPG